MKYKFFEGKKINQDGQWSVEYGENQKLSIGMVGHHVPRENGNFVFDIKLPSNFKSAQQIKYNVEYKVSFNFFQNL